MGELFGLLDKDDDKLEFAKALLLETKLLIKFTSLGSAMFVESLLNKVDAARSLLK